MITSARTAVKAPAHSDSIFVDGVWTAPRSRESFEIVDSTTEEPFMRVPLANAEDMSAAVDAARRAFDSGPWPRMTHAERAEFLLKIAAGIRSRAAEKTKWNISRIADNCRLSADRRRAPLRFTAG